MRDGHTQHTSTHPHNTCTHIHTQICSMQLASATSASLYLVYTHTQSAIIKARVSKAFMYSYPSLFIVHKPMSFCRKRARSEEWPCERARSEEYADVHTYIVCKVWTCSRCSRMEKLDHKTDTSKSWVCESPYKTSSVRGVWEDGSCDGNMLFNAEATSTSDSDDEKEEGDVQLNSMMALVSCPQYDWRCSTCDKCVNEVDKSRRWVDPRPCPKCKKPMETWKTRESICPIFKPEGSAPSPRELKVHLRT